MSGAVTLRGVPRADTAPWRGWSHARLAGAFVLAAWAGLFWFLWLSGRVAFFLSSRTDWIVPVAAVLLTAATVGRVVSARVRSPEPLLVRALWIAGLLVLPVVLILAAPPATLGTFSAGKRAGLRRCWVRDLYERHRRWSSHARRRGRRPDEPRERAGARRAGWRDRSIRRVRLALRRHPCRRVRPYALRRLLLRRRRDDRVGPKR